MTSSMKDKSQSQVMNADQIIAEIVADKQRDAAIQQRIQQVLDGQDVPTTLKMAYGH